MKEKVIKRAKGYGGQLELLKNKIRVKRRGAIASILYGKRKDKEIPVDQVSSLQFKKADITHGYIRFIINGERNEKPRHKRTNELLEEESTIFFNIFQQRDFRKVKDLIEKKIAGLKKEKIKKIKLDRLQRLARLREKGVVSKEDFNKRKKKILGIEDKNLFQ